MLRISVSGKMMAEIQILPTAKCRRDSVYNGRTLNVRAEVIISAQKMKRASAALDWLPVFDAAMALLTGSPDGWYSGRNANTDIRYDATIPASTCDMTPTINLTLYKPTNANTKL